MKILIAIATVTILAVLVFLGWAIYELARPYNEIAEVSQLANSQENKIAIKLFLVEKVSERETTTFMSVPAGKTTMLVPVHHEYNIFSCEESSALFISFSKEHFVITPKNYYVKGWLKTENNMLFISADSLEEINVALN